VTLTLLVQDIQGAPTAPTLHHDILSGILRWVVHHAGVSSTLELVICCFPGLASGASMGRGNEVASLGGRVNILIALDKGIESVDMSAQAVEATSEGPAAACRDGEKRRDCDRLEPSGFFFISISVLCFLAPTSLPITLFALALPSRLVAVALMGMVNIDLLRLPWNPMAACYQAAKWVRRTSGGRGPWSEQAWL
jgi:hypothetical protein